MQSAPDLRQAQQALGQLLAPLRGVLRQPRGKALDEWRAVGALLW